METIKESDAHYDPRKQTFSQAQGYEELPGPLKLEELPSEARTHIWNAFYTSVIATVKYAEGYGSVVAGAWADILRAKHIQHDILRVDEWDDLFEDHRASLYHSIEALPFNKVFDLIQFVLRHPKCPPSFIVEMKLVFANARLAYTIDEAKPPTIIPAATEAEGNKVIESLQLLRRVGLEGSANHLRTASECINRNDWAGQHQGEHSCRRVRGAAARPPGVQDLGSGASVPRAAGSAASDAKGRVRQALRIRLERTGHSPCAVGPIERQGGHGRGGVHAGGVRILRQLPMAKTWDGRDPMTTPNTKRFAEVASPLKQAQTVGFLPVRPTPHKPQPVTDRARQSVDPGGGPR